VTTDVAPPVVTHAHASAVLDWEAFRTAHFPGRYRHDLEAVIAYGGYRRSCATEQQASAEPTQIEATENHRAEVTALRGWEDEGGA
jgi:hypothetical protein